MTITLISNNFINVTSVYYKLYNLLRLDSIHFRFRFLTKFIRRYVLILYLFRIFLNEANKCYRALRDVGSTMI